MADPPHLLILGGGFGGLSAANELRKSLPESRVRITIIDRKDWFMVGFAKLWMMNGTRTFEESTASLDGLAARQIGFVQDEILSIDPARKTVRTGGGSIRYDFLLISMGAALAPQRIPGLAEHGFNLYDYGQIPVIRDRLAGIRSGRIAILICGMPYKCPPAPFEAGLLMDSVLRKRGVRDSTEIHIYSPAASTLPAAGPEVSRRILDMTASEGITFHGSRRIKSVSHGRMSFLDGHEDFDLLCAVPPHVAPRVIYECGLAEDPGFVMIDRNCRTRLEDVYAVGDVTTLPATDKLAVPKAGVFAEGEGTLVARAIASRISSAEHPPPFDGRGGCFIESGRDTASIIDVDMFTGQTPVTRLSDPTRANLSRKLEFEKERLSGWL